MRPMIRGWCQRWFPREADDMVQEVMGELVFIMRSFTYKPEEGRFRGWLKTVTHRMMAHLKREQASARRHRRTRRHRGQHGSVGEAGCGVRPGTPG